ncbi:hypothetical protein BDQ17DRAFT_1435773 [Cyathus striatus]|nr:hypothetical protein BDQ17DRAFT_1435773 [Cyathus striatus]
MKHVIKLEIKLWGLLTSYKVHQVDIGKLAKESEGEQIATLKIPHSVIAPTCVRRDSFEADYDDGEYSDYAAECLSSSRQRMFSLARASLPLSELSIAPLQPNAAAKACQWLQDTDMLQEKDGSSASLKKRGLDILEKDGEPGREVKMRRKMEPEKEKMSVARGSVKSKGHALRVEESEEEAPQMTSVKSAKGKNAKNPQENYQQLVSPQTQVVLTEAITELHVKTTEYPRECIRLLANLLVPSLH